MAYTYRRRNRRAFLNRHPKLRTPAFMRFYHTHNPVEPQNGTKIKALKNCIGTSNGLDTWYFKADGLYRVPANLANFLFAAGRAEASFL